MLDIDFANRLREYRHNRALTQAEAAKSAGIPYQSYVVAEGGRIGPQNKKKLLRWIDRAHRGRRHE